MSAFGQPPEAAPPEAQTTSDAPAPESTPAAAPDPGLDRLFSRMDQMAQQQNQMAQQMSALASPPAEEEDESLYYDDGGDLTEEGAQALIRDLVSAQVQEALAPREQAELIRQRDSAFEDLQDQYPDLADEATRRDVLQASIRWANAHNPELIDRPEFVDLIEWVYKADFRAAASPEVEQQRRVELESASGAGGRAKAKPDTDWGDRIVKAAERLRPSI